jgi:hypothetical protein
VQVTAHIAIRVGHLPAQAHGFSGFGLAHKQINVPLFCHSPRFWQIGDQLPDLRERHLVQLIPISKLESTQSQSRDCD